jgi:hypothetical protein
VPAAALVAEMRAGELRRDIEAVWQGEPVPATAVMGARLVLLDPTARSLLR